jgi:YidC/Oxa1 family membrane protein insertase
MFLALALSILVIMAFSYFQTPNNQQNLTEQKQETVKSDTSPSDTNPDTPSVETAEAEADTVRTDNQPSQLSFVDTSNTKTTAKDTVPFQNSGLKGYFSRRGASLSSIKTLAYSKIGRDHQLYDLVFRRGDGLKTALTFSKPSLRHKRFDFIETPDTTVFKFRTQLNNGLTLIKEYDFNETKDYHVSLSLRLKNSSSEPISVNELNFPSGTQKLGPSLRWGPGFGRGRLNKTQFDNVYWYYGKNDEMQYFAPQGTAGFTSWLPFMGSENPDNPYKFVEGPVEWSAVSNRYFVAAMVPDESFQGLFLKKGDESDSFTAWSAHNSVNLDPNGTKTYSYDLYLGPKYYSVLQSFHSGLESTLNYGWFTLLTYPLLICLRWIYAFIPNYGIAIILLSVALKFLLYPLTKKGLVSMQKMKKLQPKMKEIQEKYSDDKEKLNEKLMEFYSEHNVNPIGGCLPMLLQLPILIALYRMLEYSIELRGAHFALWVTDLSAKDPLYILPVAMGILMFFQQWYTMSAGGGATGQQQQMMMYMMPVVMVVVFMNFPSGLVVYYMTHSAVTLLQHWMINRSMDLSET